MCIHNKLLLNRRLLITGQDIGTTEEKILLLQMNMKMHGNVAVVTDIISLR